MTFIASFASIVFVGMFGFPFTRAFGNIFKLVLAHGTVHVFRRALQVTYLSVSAFCRERRSSGLLLSFRFWRHGALSLHCRICRLAIRAREAHGFRHP